MSDNPTSQELAEVRKHFSLPSIALVEKDWHVVRAIAAIVAVDSAPFSLVFGGGTAVARAHRLVRRMSEDVDFKIVLPGDATISKSQQRRQLALLRDKVTAALVAAFPFDTSDFVHLRSRDENRYTTYHLPYEGSGTAEQLRPMIQVELTYAKLRRPTVILPVASFMAEAYGREVELQAVACVSIDETAAEKLVSLTRRTAMELAGLSRLVDETLVRHIYDLHMIRGVIDRDIVRKLVAEVSISDAEEFRNQYPAYATDIQGETRKALSALAAMPTYRNRYERFMGSMVYGERPGFDEAVATIRELLEE